MENKKYLDKVVVSLVRGTNIDYENGRISTFYYLSSFPLQSLSHSHTTYYFRVFLPFSEYCRNQFGLTKDEIEYVWKKYKSIIKDKISKREP